MGKTNREYVNALDKIDPEDLLKALAVVTPFDFDNKKNLVLKFLYDKQELENACRITPRELYRDVEKYRNKEISYLGRRGIFTDCGWVHADQVYHFVIDGMIYGARRDAEVLVFKKEAETTTTDTAARCEFRSTNVATRMKQCVRSQHFGSDHIFEADPSLIPLTVSDFHPKVRSYIGKKVEIEGVVEGRLDDAGKLDGNPFYFFVIDSKLHYAGGDVRVYILD